ncbi:MAG: hypothetical protein O2834_06435 [Crenarchaeota archaeon]|nr:hypothetical protein [Thermoproteota archaeon]HJJ21082.1 hypothetical protein [Nitrosopumilus sp.]MDA0853129.1 hypothetical protein [Thermoproteota archaeon]MDA1123846.1 hypothetical protein [Thermoproteota archaeon]HJJ24399.1 hypothetical protein [Nitrosopumilus sp.]
MLVNYTLHTIETENTFHSVTLVPRLSYSAHLLDNIIETLQGKRIELKTANQYLVTDFNYDEQSHLKSLKLEHLLVCSLEILDRIKNQIGSISGINSITELLPSSIPMIRIISAKLFVLFPNCSQLLSELSVHLGSIVLDSAVLTKARFDFSKSNHVCSTLLDEVKLMANSKLNKQYPLVDFFKLLNV